MLLGQKAQVSVTLQDWLLGRRDKGHYTSTSTFSPSVFHSLELYIQFFRLEIPDVIFYPNKIPLWLQLPSQILFLPHFNTQSTSFSFENIKIEFLWTDICPRLMWFRVSDLTSINLQILVASNPEVDVSTRIESKKQPMPFFFFWYICTFQEIKIVTATIYQVLYQAHCQRL